MINYNEVEQSVHTLKKQFIEGQIDEKTFEDHLLEMVDVGNDGHYWMFGHESGKWYRHDGEMWLLAKPTDMEASAPHPTTDAETNWYNIDIGWFIASLIVIGAIGAIIYSATLI